MTAITDWSDAVMTSLAGALALFFAAIPRVLGFVVIIVLGWIVEEMVSTRRGSWTEDRHRGRSSERSTLRRSFTTVSRRELGD